MWPFKKEQPEEPEGIELNSLLKKCEECKHLIKKEDAQIVTIEYCSGFVGRYELTKYYCPEHKKPYDRRISIGGTTTYEKHIPEHWVEVKIKNSH